MTRTLHSITSALAWKVALLAVFLGGCSGGTDPILGAPGVGTRPTITATSPAASSPVVTGVATTRDVRATFSRPMTLSTLTSSFTLACPAGTPVAAAVTYDDSSRTAILTPAAAMPANTLCQATITTAATDSTGIALAANFT
jgi:hypothetical protein